MQAMGSRAGASEAFVQVWTEGQDSVLSNAGTRAHVHTSSGGLEASPGSPRGVKAPRSTAAEGGSNRDRT